MADYNINAVTRRVVFTGSAGVGPYAFTFEIIDENDLAVYFNATKLTITTDYTVSINANGTGSITIVTGSSVPSTPTASDQIVIVGARDIERVTDFVTAGDLLASSLNEQLDALTIFDQQVSEEGRRALRAPVYDPALVEDGGVVDMTLPVKASRAGKTLAFDSDGNPTVGEDIGNWRGDWAASTAYTVRDLVKDASNYNVYRCNTAHTSSGTTPISSNADSAKWDLVIDASYAATQASNAATSASNASDSADTASDHRADAGKYAVTAHNTTFTLTATNGGTSGLYSALHYATEASNSATAASTAQTAAEAAQAAAELAADDFTDRYYGAHANDSAAETYITGEGLTVDAGDLYFNTTSSIMRVYDGSAWDNVAVSTSGLLAVANNLSDLADSDTALTNLGLTATATELNYNDVTTLGTVEASKTVTADASGDITIPDNRYLYWGTAQTISAKWDTSTSLFTIAGGRTQFEASVLGKTMTSDVSGATTLSFSTYQNFVLTLTGNLTLSNPTTELIGQSGFIVFKQNATGGYTLSLGTDYKTAGGSGITLSTAASAIDVVPYVVSATGEILLGTPQLAFA